jgi:hypothetical protein
MKIEAGKYYTARDGRKACVLGINSTPNAKYPWVGFIEGNVEALSWTITGMYRLLLSDALDLVSVWKDSPQVEANYDWSKLPAWAKCIYRRQKGTWIWSSEVVKLQHDGWWFGCSTRHVGTIPPEFAPKADVPWMKSLTMLPKDAGHNTGISASRYYQ